MAISPPSDIVLDVARAADPAAVETARAGLMSRTQASGVAATFDAGLVSSRASGGAPILGRQAEAPSAPQAAKKFEAMVLQTFISSMMPKDAESTFGTGLSGDMWKSLMAEKVAGVVADRGGIGIADRVLGDFEMKNEQMKPVAGIDQKATNVTDSEKTAAAGALMDQLQRQMTKNIMADAGSQARSLFDK